MDRREYSTAVEGGAPVRVRYRIAGRIDPRSYLAFVADRARWLAIDGWASAGEGQATVVAAGPEALVGALEMACTLGPLDALIEEIVASDEAEPVSRGFAILETVGVPRPRGSTGSP